MANVSKLDLSNLKLVNKKPNKMAFKQLTKALSKCSIYRIEKEINSLDDLLEIKPKENKIANNKGVF